ncbi:MAG TPA: FISUMP domain-containing protein [Bacteroidia bacterium]|nr:FISUMP domain-containing protein [Bacteroidia bacterium]HRH65013.1 FISUMP domain-containing protein [Bacteroidia bacterium]
MKYINLVFLSLIFIGIQSHGQTVTDIDGNVYPTVTIGTQIWMKENLRVTHDRYGNFIPNVRNDSVWSILSTGARSYYNNDSSSYSGVYGALYNWYAVDNICPINWHVPVDNDWIILIGYLGGTNVAGGAMKSIFGWNFPNTGATDSSGFSGLPGGDRYDSGPYNYRGFFGHWWSSTANAGVLRFATLLSYDNAQAVKYYFNVNAGFAIRCVCDLPPTQIHEKGIDLDFQIYPNPATDRLVVKFKGKQEIEVVIYSILGEQMMKKIVWEMNHEIDIRTLPVGMYFIQLHDSDRKVQKVFLKE